VPPAPRPQSGIEEAAALWWREDVSERTLRRRGRRWTMWTAWIVCVFATPGLLLLYLEPLSAPVAAICFAHAWLIPRLQARRGADSVVPIGGVGDRVGPPRAHSEPERIALGLLADLVGHSERALLAGTGLAMERGRLGVWLLGERGALLLRPGGRRVDCWCVRVADQDGLPGADRVAHLLLALREDEGGFAKVGNLGFSGAVWRVRSGLSERPRVALDAARAAARDGAGGWAAWLGGQSVDEVDELPRVA
jgi:hypothetical protein